MGNSNCRRWGNLIDVGQSFWQIGVPGLVISDSGPFRNAHYHELSDTPDTLDYTRMAQLSEGLLAAIRAEAQVPCGNGRQLDDRTISRCLIPGSMGTRASHL